MKKWLALLLVLVLCLALAACGDDKKSNDDDEDADEGETTTTTTIAGGEGDGDDWGELLNPVTPATRTLPTTSTTTTVYVAPTQATTTKNPLAETSAVAEFVERYKANVEAMSNEQMTLSLVARGNSVAYVYKYTTIYDFTQEMQDTLVQGMEAQGDTLATALDGMRSECPQISSIIYEYYTADNDLIASYEYK